MACPVYAQSEMFFFISSIGFIVLFALGAILIYQLIRAVRAFTRLVEKTDESVEKLGESAEEMLDDVRDSNVYRFIFGKRRRSKKK